MGCGAIRLLDPHTPDQTRKAPGSARIKSRLHRTLAFQGPSRDLCVKPNPRPHDRPADRPIKRTRRPRRRRRQRRPREATHHAPPTAPATAYASEHMQVPTKKSPLHGRHNRTSWKNSSQRTSVHRSAFLTRGGRSTLRHRTSHRSVHHLQHSESARANCAVQAGFCVSEPINLATIRTCAHPARHG